MIGNLFLIAILVIVGFNPLQPARDIVGEMFNFLEDVLKEFWQSIMDLIF